MLGPITQKYIYIGFWWNQYLHCLPYKWDPQERTLTVKKGLKARFGWHFSQIVFTLFLVWSVVRTYNCIQNLDGTMSKLFYFLATSCATLSETVVFIFGINQILIVEELPFFIQEYIATTLRFKELYFIKGKDFVDKPGMVICFLWWGAAVVQFLIVLGSFFQPNQPLLFVSVITVSSWHLWILLRVLNSILIFYIVAVGISNLFIYCAIGMEITISVDCGMRELNLDSPKYVTRDSIREPGSFRLEYRLVQIMFRVAEPIFCPVVVPAHGWLFQVIIVLLVNGAVRLKGIVFCASGFTAVIFTVYLVVGFSAFGKLWTTTHETLHSWERRCNSIYMQKYLRTCHPFSIKVGMFYYCDMGMIPNMLEYIISNSISLLVMF